MPGGSAPKLISQAGAPELGGYAAQKLRRERPNLALPITCNARAQTQSCQLYTMPGGSAPKLRPERERLNSGHWKDTEPKAQVK